MKKTTIAHIILERLRQMNIHLKFPSSITGDLVKEHDWAMSTSGFDLINNFRDVFDDVCNEVDEQIDTGNMVFTDEGVIILR